MPAFLGRRVHWKAFSALPSRLRLVFKKPCNELQPSGRFVATLGDPAAGADLGVANPGDPRQFSIEEH